jgi:hypothetical protein
MRQWTDQKKGKWVVNKRRVRVGADGIDEQRQRGSEWRGHRRLANFPVPVVGSDDGQQRSRRLAGMDAAWWAKWGKIFVDGACRYGLDSDKGQKQPPAPFVPLPSCFSLIPLLELLL